MFEFFVGLIAVYVLLKMIQYELRKHTEDLRKEIKKLKKDFGK